MTYELGALIDSTRTITVHSATPHDEPDARAALSAVALRHIVARDPARARAFREASLALQHVRHSGLLAVQDLLEVDGRPVAVAPLPAGAPLSRVMLAPRRCGRRFGVPAAMRVVLDVARALQVVHAARPDLRPLGFVSAETVWVTTEARAILLPSASCAPVNAGTRAPPWSRYRAPECGGPTVATDSADVHSLGVLLWELLAASKPKPRELSASGEAIEPWIDPEVVRLVMRARSADVPTRPRDPGAFAAELARLLTKFGDGVLDPTRGGLPIAADDEKTVPRFVPQPDDEKTVPGCVPQPVPDDEDAATVELPLRAPEAFGAVGFAVVAPPVRAATEPAAHGSSRRPEVPRRPRAVPSPPRLKIVESAESAAAGELCLANEPRRWVVGRAASAHLVVADPDMSREHFAVMWEGEGRYRVRDLGSKNGLFVNGKAATDSRLAPGDEVRAGGTRLRFEA